MNEQDIRQFYSYLKSQQTAQKFLKACYQYEQCDHPEVKSYENCESFLYYLDHGEQFYTSGKRSPIMVKPILYFYGMVHLLKACLLTVRPDYPESTKILAHGLSARKRKKKDYSFLEDEVKVQQNGLFPYFSKYLFSIEHMTPDRMSMRFLLSFIPELIPLFQFQNEQKLIEIGHLSSDRLIFPNSILDRYYIGSTTFINRLKVFLPHFKESRSLDDQQLIEIKLAKPLTIPQGPFFLHADTQALYFPVDRDHFLPISEVMIHYLLLYNLSMVSRYETGWWGDLLATKATNDYPFIYEFLNVTAKKMPLFLGQYLYQKYLQRLPF